MYPEAITTHVEVRLAALTAVFEHYGNESIEEMIAKARKVEEYLIDGIDLPDIEQAFGSQGMLNDLAKAIASIDTK